MFFTMPKNPMGWNSAPFENPSRRGRLKVSKRYISSCTRYFLLRRTHRTDVTLIVLYKINFDHKSRRMIWKKIVKNLDNLVWCLRFTTYRKMHTINRLDGPYVFDVIPHRIHHIVVTNRCWYSNYSCKHTMTVDTKTENGNGTVQTLPLVRSQS